MRVSITDLDAYRRWKRQEDSELPDLLSFLRREKPPTEQMLAGSAFHKALEFAQSGAADSLEVDGYRFLLDLDAEIALPEIREIKAEKQILVEGAPVTLVGKVDAIHGTRVEDHKTTSRFDAERFLDAYQWRYYLDLFGADHFRWNVFVMAEQPEPKVYRVYDFHTLDQYRYADMHDDCMRLLREFVAFAQTHLPERLKEAA